MKNTLFIRKTIILWIFLVVSVTNINCALAKKMSAAEAKANARAMGSGLSGMVQGFATTDIEVNASIKKGLNYQGTDSNTIPEQKLNSSNMEGEASIKKENSKQAEIVRKGFYNREDHDLAALSKSLGKVREAQKDPEKHVKFLSGNKECEDMKKEDIISKAEYVCDEYADWKDNNCKVGQIVEVDAKHRYECEIKREKRTGYCEKKLVGIDCEGRHPCAFEGENGGGLYTSESNREFAASSGGKFKWNYDSSSSELVFGNDSSYSYDAGESCGVQEFTAKFYIKEKEKVSEFAMSELFENNVMDIWVNGHLIYEGRYHGVDPPNSDCGRGNSPRYCWMNACHEHWKTHYKDLRNYIIDGWNQIKIKLSYTRGGHAGLKIKAKQYCCSSLKEKWEDECERLQP